MQDGEGHINLTSADVDSYKSKKTDYLLAGTYTCVGNQTYFHTYKTTATSKAPNTFGWMIEYVKNECIIPKHVLQMKLPQMATFTVVLALTRSEYDVVLNEGKIEKGVMLCPNVYIRTAAQQDAGNIRV